jgi:hypothetical protein
MKKLYFIILIFTISIYMAACDQNPYVGQYKSPDNTVLILSSNNDCTIIYNLYKEAFYTEGKYTINDNNINITLASNETNYYGISSLKGKFEGNSIKIYNSSVKQYNTYSKE